MGAEKRGVDRDPCLIEAAIRLEAQARPIDCVIEDISESGARVRIAGEQKLPPTFVLMVPVVAEHHEEKPVELKWQVGAAAGVRFSPTR